MKNIVLLVLGVAAPLLTLAHAGHGNENPLSPGHYIANPEHAVPLVLSFVIGIILFVRLVFRSRKRTQRK
jgi:hypothetical protein